MILAVLFATDETFAFLILFFFLWMSNLEIREFSTWKTTMIFAAVLFATDTTYATYPSFFWVDEHVGDPKMNDKSQKMNDKSQFFYKKWTISRKKWTISRKKWSISRNFFFGGWACWRLEYCLIYKYASIVYTSKYIYLYMYMKILESPFSMWETAMIFAAVLFATDATFLVLILISGLSLIKKMTIFARFFSP